jgi:type IV secretion system protein VirD4
MILLIESQRPIFGSKLRFHEVAPFKMAARLSIEHQPLVPDADFVPSLPVPATEAVYGGASRAVESAVTQGIATISRDDVPLMVARGLSARHVPHRKGIVTTGGGTEAADHRIVGIEARLKPTAERLRGVVEAKVAHDPSISARSRLSIAEVLKQTVPDPVEIGLV